MPQACFVGGSPISSSSSIQVMKVQPGNSIGEKAANALSLLCMWAALFLCRLFPFSPSKAEGKSLLPIIGLSEGPPCCPFLPAVICSPPTQ